MEPHPQAFRPHRVAGGGMRAHAVILARALGWLHITHEATGIFQLHYDLMGLLSYVGSGIDGNIMWCMTAGTCGKRVQPEGAANAKA